MLYFGNQADLAGPEIISVARSLIRVTFLSPSWATHCLFQLCYSIKNVRFVFTLRRRFKGILYWMMSKKAIGRRPFIACHFSILFQYVEVIRTSSIPSGGRLQVSKVVGVSWGQL